MQSPLCAIPTRLVIVAASALLILTSFSHADVTLYGNGDIATSGGGTSWTSAFKYLQDALNEAEVIASETNPVDIWVAATVESNPYRPDACATCGSGGGPGSSGDELASFELHNNVAIYGGFAGTESQLDERDPAANVTVLSGDLLGDDSHDPDPFQNYDDNSYHVLDGPETDATAILDGFTITGGNALETGEHGRGGGVRLGSATTDSEAKIRTCRFVYNRAYFGGAISSWNQSASQRLKSARGGCRGHADLQRGVQR